MTIQFPKWEIHKNIFKKWHFFNRENQTIIAPAFTSNPPQLHQQKPRYFQPFFAKPPAKTPLHHAKKNHLRNFVSTTGVECRSNEKGGQDGPPFEGANFIFKTPKGRDLRVITTGPRHAP
ncbi:MAG: hypothetical protein WDN23_02405 [Edaphobacter sp.]